MSVGQNDDAERQDVESLISFMEIRLEEIRANLLSASVGLDLISGYYMKVQEIKFHNIDATQEQENRLADIKARYLKLFEMYQ